MAVGSRSDSLAIRHRNLRKIVGSRMHPTCESWQDIRTKSREYTEKSCIFTQTHVRFDSCRKTRDKPRRNVQSPSRFSRNESRVTEKKVYSNWTKTAFLGRKVEQSSKFSCKARGAESARIFTNLHEFAWRNQTSMMRHQAGREAMSAALRTAWTNIAASTFFCPARS